MFERENDRVTDAAGAHARSLHPGAVADEFRPRVWSYDSTELDKGVTVAHITHVGRVMVPVADQDEAIAFYTGTLGFSFAADVPFGEGDRWVEVAPPGGGAAIALVPPQGDYQPG